MDATRLKIVEHEKDLGVVIDSELKFEDHITRIGKKAYSAYSFEETNNANRRASKQIT